MIWQRERTPGQRGKQAEQGAASFLEQQGCEVVERNFHCRLGEIDIIVRDGSTLVFVEVRCRQNPRFGSAAESVTRRKQQRLLAAAQLYLAKHPRNELPCRMDVIEAQPDIQGRWQFNWLKNAFQE